MIRSATLFLLAALALPATAATKSTNPAARKLIDQAVVDLKAGNFAPAVDALLAARQLEARVSEAPALLASFFYELSRGDDSHRSWQLRRQAAFYAGEALHIEPHDIDAEDVMTGLSGAFDQQAYEPAPAIVALSEEGDKLYDARQFLAASRKYEEVIARDPRYPKVYVSLGDSLGQLRETAGAEQAYRKAIGLDRNFEAAWVALNTLMSRQKRDKEADAAAYGAVAALPTTIDGWNAMFTTLRRQGGKVRNFAFTPKGSYSVQRKSVLVEPGMTGANLAAWTAVAEAQRAASDPARKLTPFGVQLATWEAALNAIATTDKTDPVSDATLRDMLAFRQAGQLKAALFVLQYREAYRADFEAWKKAEPDGLKRFIDTFRIGP